MPPILQERVVLQELQNVTKGNGELGNQPSSGYERKDVWEYHSNVLWPGLSIRGMDHSKLEL